MKIQLSLFVLAGLVSSLSFAGSVTVDITLSPAGSFKAKTSDIKGIATVKGDEISASNVVVPLKGLKTGVELRDKHTLKHLEADKYPEAVLVSASGKGGKGTGKIKVKGIEKNIAGTYKINGGNVEAEFDLSLPDFKITDINYMGVGVEDKVTLHIVMPIKK